MERPKMSALKQLAKRVGLVGESEPMIQAMNRLLQVAPTDLTVLVTGETGTGKEVFARALHDLSKRKRQPFVSVNCGAIPETLLESELFGAEKGAYTGADARRIGFFESAHTGTIFLDEIGEMPTSTQVKLLRILESGEYSRLGSSDMKKVDVRVIAATNRDLIYEVKKGRFRQDLFFRLNSVNIALPPLRQHMDDIPVLVEHFANRVAAKNEIEYRGIDSEAIRALQTHNWPGNIRELRNIVETMVTLERGRTIDTEMVSEYLPADDIQMPESTQALVHLPNPMAVYSESSADIQMLYRTMLQMSADISEVKTVLRHLLSLTFEGGSPSPSSTAVSPVSRPAQDATALADEIADEELNLAKIERMALEMSLRKTNGNRREAANILGISERTLYRKIDEYGLT